ncbi:hypothetical protein AB0910_13660 [Streptomyces sp. NPDC047002]|uniref:hypothetical protein n=1 Tax=Streptomyces sp. NPDC047002 TaxID=3155475 RepID=UPI0034561713
MSLDPTGTGQARWTMRWKTALNAFDTTFDGRPSATRQQPQPPQVHRSFDGPNSIEPYQVSGNHIKYVIRAKKGDEGTPDGCGGMPALLTCMADR